MWVRTWWGNIVDKRSTLVAFCEVWHALTKPSVCYLGLDLLLTRVPKVEFPINREWSHCLQQDATWTESGVLMTRSGWISSSGTGSWHRREGTVLRTWRVCRLHLTKPDLVQITSPLWTSFPLGGHMTFFFNFNQAREAQNSSVSTLDHHREMSSEIWLQDAYGFLYSWMRLKEHGTADENTSNTLHLTHTRRNSCLLS